MTATDYTHVRWGLAADLRQMLPIEAGSFAEPWAEADFRAVLRERNCICMVAERGDRIDGFMLYQLHPAHLELLNFAVRPAARRAGVGAALMAKLRYKVASHRRERLVAVAHEDSTGAHLFFRACGLAARRVLARHYPDGAAGYEFVYQPTAAEWEPFGGAPINRVAGY